MKKNWGALKNYFTTYNIFYNVVMYPRDTVEMLNRIGPFQTTCMCVPIAMSEDVSCNNEDPELTAPGSQGAVCSVYILFDGALLSENFGS